MLLLRQFLEALKHVAFGLLVNNGRNDQKIPRGPRADMGSGIVLFEHRLLGLFADGRPPGPFMESQQPVELLGAVEVRGSVQSSVDSRD